MRAKSATWRGTASHDITVLHRSAHFRGRVVDHHHPGGDDRGNGIAHCPIPSHHAADRPGVVQLSRRQRQVVADTVAAPIEQQVNGVEGMLYMSSQCGNDGSYTLTVTFDLGTDLNTALVMVQNRVALAMPQLPTCVQQQGMTIKKKSPEHPAGRELLLARRPYDDLYLSNYATIHVKDELFRLPGVGDITYLGQRDYSIRAWLDPAEAGVAQHHRQRGGHRRPAAERRAGRRARSASRRCPPGQAFQLPIDTLGRLDRPEQFGDIIVKATTGRRRGRPGSSASATWRGSKWAASNYNHQLHARRQALGGPGHLPASRHQRPGRGRSRPRARWRS